MPKVAGGGRLAGSGESGRSAANRKLALRHERTFLGEPSVRDRGQINERPEQRQPSVDVELVALRVFHRDCAVVEAFGVQDTDELGTETGQTARLRVDAPPARLDRHRAAA